MKTEKQKDFSNFFDTGPEEPELCKRLGFDNCQDCYFRSSTLKRITDGVKRIQQEGL